MPENILQKSGSSVDAIYIFCTAHMSGTIRDARENSPMPIRLICWAVAMAYICFLLVSNGSKPPLGVTISALAIRKSVLEV
jgi:hypothetical protein